MKLSKLLITLASITVLQGCVAAAVVGIAGGAQIAADKRTVGQVIDDQTLELELYSILSKEKALAEHSNIQLTVVNGTLLIVGQTPNSYLKELAAKTFSNVKGITQVHNQLRVSNITSLLTRSNDVWLTSKVKTILFSDSEIEATNIKIVTENSEVFLMGLVSAQQATKSIEITRNISGVSRVFNAFEYVE